MSAGNPSIPKRPGRRRAATLIILGLVTFLVILKLSGFRASWAAFTALNPMYVVAALAVYYLSFYLRAVRWKILLIAIGQRLSVPALFSYILVGWFISAAVPARAGDVARAYLLKNDRGIPLRRGLGTIFVERGLDGLVILCGSLLFSFFMLSMGLPKWVVYMYQITFALLIFVLVFIYFMPRLETKARALLASFRWRKLVFFMFRLGEEVRIIARSPGCMLAAFFFTSVIWICDALVTYLVLMGLGHSLPWAWVAFIAFTVNLAATLPITPGAVGQIDVVQFSLFSLIGVAKEISGVAILISRLICFWSFLLISGLFTYGSGLARLVRGTSAPKGLMEAPLESEAALK